MTNLEKLTKDKNTLADWLAMHAMCEFCPARFGTCQEQTDHALCRLNWRDGDGHDSRNVGIQVLDHWLPWDKVIAWRYCNKENMIKNQEKSR